MAEKEAKSCSEECEEMTDNEIIKALEVCSHFDACLKECPLFNYKAGCIRRLTASALEIIKRYQSDVAPVKYGHWVEKKSSGLGGIWDYYFVCSVCGGNTPNKAYVIAPDYCPNCGARMDG